MPLSVCLRLASQIADIPGRQGYTAAPPYAFEVGAVSSPF